MESRYQENGTWWTAPGVPYVPKTKLELANDRRNRALQNLTVAAEDYTKACAAHKQAKFVASQPCSCEGQCTNCGGKK
jgi:hypothetical protein